MKKSKLTIICMILGGILLVLCSYLLYSSGTTNMLSDFFNRSKASALNQNKDVYDYPIINFVINSTGEKVVNTDALIEINATDNVGITKFEYSFDKNKWYDNFDEVKYGNEATARITFDKTIHQTIYISVKNKIGNYSYYYETLVKIDKKRPDIKVQSSENKVNVITKDNNKISKVQVSYDNLNWDTISINSTMDTYLNTSIDKPDGNLYIRAVDIAGNISKVIKVK